MIKRFTPYLYTLLVKPDLQIKLLLTRAKCRHLALSSLIRRFSEGVSKLLSWRRKIFKFVTFRKNLAVLKSLFLNKKRPHLTWKHFD